MRKSLTWRALKDEKSGRVKFLKERDKGLRITGNAEGQSNPLEWPHNRSFQ